MKNVTLRIIGAVIAFIGPTLRGAVEWNRQEYTVTAQPDASYVYATYECINLGEHDIMVKVAKPTDRSVKVLVRHLRLGPGESGVVSLMLRLSVEEAKSVHVNVRTFRVGYDAAAESTVLRCNVVVPRLYMVRPTVLHWTKDDRDVSKRITIRQLFEGVINPPGIYIPDNEVDATVERGSYLGEWVIKVTPASRAFSRVCPIYLDLDVNSERKRKVKVVAVIEGASIENSADASVLQEGVGEGSE